MKEQKNGIPILRAKIEKHSREFTKSEKKIANYIQDHAKEIPFLSIHSLAEITGIGQGSIMRFSQKIGYVGFAALKKEIINSIQNDLAPLEKFKMKLNNTNKNSNLLENIAQTEVSNINFLFNNFDVENFEKIISLINISDNIYIAGVSLSSHLANLMSYFFQRIGLKAISLNQMGLGFIDQLISIRKNDLLIAFSLPPYSEETIEAAKYVKHNSGQVVSFTNTLTAPIVEYSDYYQLFATESPYISNSISPIITYMIALTTSLAMKNKNRSMKAIEKIISTRT